MTDIYWLNDCKVSCNILEVSVGDSPKMQNTFISKYRKQRFLECLLADFIIYIKVMHMKQKKSKTKLKFFECNEFPVGGKRSGTKNACEN
jgi:hypothetical protein